MFKCYLGYEPREDDGYQVCEFSIHRRTSKPIEVIPIEIEDMRKKGLYDREMEMREGRLWDNISDAPCATGFAITRFLVPILAKHEGWALFCDGSDMMFTEDIWELEQYFDPKYAVICTQHKHEAVDGSIKMDNQIQTAYRRKNWSSVMLFNCAHPSNKALDKNLVNSVPGRDLHGFCWLKDEEIGSLPLEWNYLVMGDSQLCYNKGMKKTVKNVHFTEGIPSMPNYEKVMFSDDWRLEQDIMKQSGYHKDLGV